VIVAVASGKGGTGKTTVTASLAAVWDRPLAAVDLDVEEPNLHLFLRPELGAPEDVHMEIPVVDEERCTRCRACADLCQFKAITLLGEHLLVFPEMCHGCGGCLLVCPEKALSPGARILGVLEQGNAGPARFLMGRLRVGEAMSPPLMRAVKKRLDGMLAAQPADALLDAPPGVSCPAVNAVMDSDVILLVTEPTPFGLHDFRLAHQAFAPMGKPMGVVVNRAGIGDDSVQGYCREQGLPLLAEIPYSRAVAEAYARGRVVATLGPEHAAVFASLRDALRRLHGEAGHA
jgi:MinD superfamily P-loop ATPase